MNTTYMLAPDLQLGLAYIFNDAKPGGSASTRVHQVNLGAVYSLSKRTAVYAVAIGQKSSGAGLGINPSTGQTENLAQIPNIVNSDTDKQLAVIVGVRHNF
ncbi:porin [Paraburkholderia fungorum]|uniref:hypothetical protein n=1 Tax=Paraburkholderia fungorum TaxID=134537 RepID=UPI0038BA6925